MLAGPARAAEQVTLRNGFALRCDHHAPVDGRVRVFLSAGGSNYIEFRPEEIAGVEAVADEPAAGTAGRAMFKNGLSFGGMALIGLPVRMTKDE